MFLHFTIAPHFLEAIEFSLFGMHHMNNHVHVIDQNPCKRVMPFVTVGLFTGLRFHEAFNIISDSLDLGTVIRLADNEEISNGFGYLFQIKRYDIPSFLIADGFYDRFEKFTALCQFSRTVLWTCS